MGIIDVILIFFLLIFTVKGGFNGFIKAAVSIAGIILGFVFSFMIYTPMLKLVSYFGFKGDVASVTAYIIGFILIYISVLVAGHIIYSAINYIKLGWFDRVLGCLFGLLKAAAVASLLLWGTVYFFPRDAKVVVEIKDSPVAKQVMKIVPFIYEQLNGVAGLKRINPFKK